MKQLYAVSYGRVSDPRQADKGISVPAQLQANRHYAESNNIIIVAEDADEGKSAFRDDIKRPRFERLLHIAKTDPRITLFLVHDSSRFCRRKRQANVLKADLERHGVRVVSVTSPYDEKTIAGKWMESIEETRSETESMAISLHVLSKMKSHIAMRDPETGWCYKNGGRAPAGYRNVRVQRGVDSRGIPVLKQLWEHDPEWATLLRHIVVDCKIAQRMSHKAIVEYLNAQKIRSPEGRPICISFICELFREDRLLQAAGYAFWNREDRRVKGQRFKDRSEWVTVENAHPAIISREEAQRAREMCGQKHRTRVPPRLEDSPWLFTGKNFDSEDFFVCTACGGRMASHIQGGRHKPSYRCGTVTYQGKEACRNEQIEKVWLEAQIVSQIKSRFTSETLDLLMLQVAEAVEAETSQYKVALGNIEKAIREANTEIGNLVKAVAKGANVDLYNTMIDECQAGLRELHREKEKLALAKPAISNVDIQRLKEYVNSLDQVLAQGTNRERRDFIRTFIRRMKFDPDEKRITIYWYANPIQVQSLDMCTHEDVRCLTGVGGGT
ncbi:MAG: recombinase family protein [Desulforudis sp.]|nr:MAG: recombinase family protein [Desulforudis sp.]